MANNPRSIILCVPVGRFTAEDIETVNHFVKIPLMKYVIVLFTRFDDWKRDNEGSTARNHGFDGFIEFLTEYPKAFLRKCKNRYIAFDNTLNADETGKQVQELIEMIHTTVNEHGTH